MDPDPPWLDLGVLRGLRRQVEGAGERVVLPGPENGTCFIKRSKNDGMSKLQVFT